MKTVYGVEMANADDLKKELEFETIAGVHKAMKRFNVQGIKIGHKMHWPVQAIKERLSGGKR